MLLITFDTERLNGFIIVVGNEAINQLVEVRTQIISNYRQKNLSDLHWTSRARLSSAW